MLAIRIREGLRAVLIVNLARQFIATLFVVLMAVPVLRAHAANVSAAYTYHARGRLLMASDQLRRDQHRLCVRHERPPHQQVASRNTNAQVIWNQLNCNHAPWP